MDDDERVPHPDPAAVRRGAGAALDAVGWLTGVFLVPTMISRLLDDPRVHAGSYDVARPAAPGHERVPVRLHQRVGKPAFAVDLRLVAEDGKDVPPGEVGEIVTRSRAVVSGYLGMPRAAART